MIARDELPKGDIRRYLLRKAGEEGYSPRDGTPQGFRQDTRYSLISKSKRYTVAVTHHGTKQRFTAWERRTPLGGFPQAPRILGIYTKPEQALERIGRRLRASKRLARIRRLHPGAEA